MAIIRLDRLIKLEGIEAYKVQETGRMVYVMQIVPSFGWPMTVRIGKKLYDILKGAGKALQEEKVE